MEIKITAAEAVAGHQAIHTMLNEKLSVNLSFKLALIAKQLETTVNTFNSARDDLLQQYGKEVEDKPGTYNIPQENTKVFQESLQAMLGADTVVTISAKLPLADFGSEKLPGNAVAQLTWLIEG